MIFLELKDSLDLPIVGSQGDIALVNDGAFKRYYVWNSGCWRHQDDYVCPVKIKDIYNEPNV